MSSAPPPGRQLFVWWKTPAAPQALAAARALQSRLAAQLPGLTFELMCREPVGPRVTVMEIYRLAGGVEPIAEALITCEGDAALAPWLEGPRVVEVFVPAPG